MPASPFLRALRIVVSVLASIVGRPSLLPLCASTIEAGLDPLPDHGALEFGEHAHHLKHRFAGRRRRIEPLLMEHEVNSERVQLEQEADEILQGAAKPIDRPCHHHIELATGGILAQCVECRPLDAPFGTADALVPVDADDVPAHAGSNRA
jgi:hypothetical protein